MSISLHSPQLPRTHRIASVREETENVHTFTFDVSLGAKPGQFVMVWIPGVDEIPLSVSDDTGEQLSITFFVVGNGSTALSKMKKGDLVGLRGPFGTHYEWKKKDKVALIAGGYGAAPLYFAAKHVSASGNPLTVLLGARSDHRLLFEEQLSSLKPAPDIRVATDDGSKGIKGYNTVLLKELIDSGDCPDLVLSCGPEPMLKAVADICHHAKVPCQLSLHRYMKCGYGLCGSCTMDPTGMRVCIEGPVVDGETCLASTEFGVRSRDELGQPVGLH